MIEKELYQKVHKTKQAAMEVLLHNAQKGRGGLFRTAAWGYHEPYTRDIMISSLGIVASKNDELLATLGRTLKSLAKHQSPLGLISGLADDPLDLGASDTTPLFLIGLYAYRKATGDASFLEEARAKAALWMMYQSPADRVLVAQQPTSDWRDEQWVLGYGLYVNILVYAYLCLSGQSERATILSEEINRPVLQGEWIEPHTREGLALTSKPYYALWSYKLYNGERFDLLGNSLAILSGAAKREKGQSIVKWVETTCDAMCAQGVLSVDLSPNFFPFIQPNDPDWVDRYRKFNNPGDYHNGGIWPFIFSFYIAALVALGDTLLAERKLGTLTDLVSRSKRQGLAFGFNEWYRANDGAPAGEDWQTWSAAMYIYAAACVETNSTPLFDEMRGGNW